MMMQIKRLILGVLILSGVASGMNYDYWHLFKQNFISKDGRVIDHINNQVSHTESIGYGMFFAVSYGDVKSFQKIHDWLHKNMELNKNNLYAWKWGRRGDGSWGVLDYNNATDGDMWIAYSLLLAYEKWGVKNYLDEAKTLIENIKKHTIVKERGKLLLLPSQFGFVKRDHIKLNPSYTIPFIFDKFAIYDKDEVWETLVLDSIDMFRGSALGSLKIHPDWILYDKVSGTYGYYGDESVFGFDSIRVPLFLGYQYKLKRESGVRDILAGYRVFMRYIQKLQKFIYQIDFKSYKVRFKHPPYGFLAVYKYLFQIFKLTPPKSLQTKIDEGLKNETNNYYSFSLLLFTDILN
jgi:endo-1,4-beta-D-glucanase Y